MTGRDKRQATRMRIIVRRGALRRFDRLKQDAADRSITISWDRRQRERRVTTQSVTHEKREHDRRQEPPFTWDLADFVVVGDEEERSGRR